MNLRTTRVREYSVLNLESVVVTPQLPRLVISVVFAIFALYLGNKIYLGNKLYFWVKNVLVSPY